MENKTLYHELSEKELKTARETYRKAQAGRSKGFLIWLVLALGLVLLGSLMRTQDGGTSIDNFNETFTVLGVVFALLFIVGNFRSIKKYKAIKEKASKIEPALAAMFQQELDVEKAEATIKEIANTSYLGGTYATLNTISKRPPMERSKDTMELFERLLSICKKYDLGGLSPIESGGGSDSCYTQAAGVTSICGMGGCGEFCHTNKEYILTESVSLRAKIISAFLVEDVK